MANNAGQLAVLAAGYLLGRTRSMKTVLMVAGGVAYGRLTAPNGDGESASGALLSRLGNSSIAEAAREAITTTATKGVESLNKNLQERSEALRNPGSSDEESEDKEAADDEASEDSEDQEAADDEASEDSEASESQDAKEETEETTKSGDS